jgi:NADPH:quinone reductase-like Zn-dependent oxidoreductase
MQSSALSLTRQALLVATLGSCIGVALADTPKEQKAIVQTGTGGPEVLKLQTVPVLEPGEGQVLIRVYAAAVNPTDWETRSAKPGYAAVGPVVIPGGDVAGVVEKLGSSVTAPAVGTPVFAVVARAADPLNGGYSQFATAAIANVVPKPPNMTYAEASGLGIATITGVRNVIETKVSAGQRVLITGIAGGVGSAAAQAAKAKGAYVIGTASARHNDYLKSIGVDEVVDYTQVKFEDKVKNVDVVIDTVGSDTAERALTTLKKGGFYISVAARGLDAKCAAAGVTCVGRMSASVVPRSVYEEVASLATSGKLKVNVEKTFPLDQAALAQAVGAQGHTEGKIVLIVDGAKAERK